MGVPRLLEIFRPLGQHSDLSGSIVIDGPSFAYWVLNLCLRGTRIESPSEQPSYQLLGETAIAWLNQLQAYGTTISAIFFDGYLPSSKRKERMLRSLKRTKNLIKYAASYPSDVPKARPEWEPEFHVELFPRTGRGHSSGTAAPIPPLHVPAIIEILRTSAYGTVTKVISGEAEAFCARYVRANGGIVISSDSDVLVHDHGPHGAAVFFHEIALKSSHPLVITAPLYISSHICQQLSLARDSGLVRLAFELSRSRHTSLQEAIESSKKEFVACAKIEEYEAFSAQFLNPETAVDTKVFLDPRVSEIALHWSKYVSTSAKVATNVELIMCLPFLLECPSRTSAWEASSCIRELAYSLLQLTSGQRLRNVAEIRKVSHPEGRGKHLAVPALAELPQEAAALVDRITQIAGAINDPNLTWAVLSIYLDIRMHLQDEKWPPLSLELMRQETSGELQPNSWMCLHFAAQVTATYYSIRILQQLLDFVASETPGQVAPLFLKLRGSISTLPALTRFPQAGECEKLLSSTREAGGLHCLSIACGFSDGEVILIRQSQESQRRT